MTGLKWGLYLKLLFVMLLALFYPFKAVLESRNVLRYQSITRYKTL